MTDGAIIKVAILGAGGYGAGELLRLLVHHPQATVVGVTSTSHVGAAVAAVHPHLKGFYDGLTVSQTLDLDRLEGGGGPAVVFSALPHGASGRAIAALLEGSVCGTGHRPVRPGMLNAASDQPAARVADGLRIVDLSGDFRLRDAAVHARHYPDSPVHEELRQRFVYGLPEFGAEARTRITEARWVANPGCLATAAILAGAPLAAAEGGGLLGKVVVDAKTGSSGSGRQLKEATHHPTRHADFRAYRPLEHQHVPEIVRAWGGGGGGGGEAGCEVCADPFSVSFVAQSMDVTRGIFVTVHATLEEEADAESLRRRYVSFYRDAPFVRVVDRSPTLQDVVGSNFCDVSVACRGRDVIAMAALDNLVKGMAGTAIQNMNLMCGLEETTGLWFPSLRPV